MPALPFVYNRLNIGTDYAFEAGVRAGQEWVAQNVPGVFMLDLDDVPLGPDTHHYGVLSKIEIGYRFANAMLMANSALAGDLDCDGYVGIADLNIVLGDWNRAVDPGVWLNSDPSGDGFVGIADLNTVLGNWNTGAPPGTSSIPEPGSFTLVALLGVSLMYGARSKR